MTGAGYNDTFSRPAKDLGGVPALCACSGEAAARRGYDAVQLAAAYDIPGHCSYGLLGLRGKYSILKITQGSIIVLTTVMLPICKIKIRYHEAGTVYLYSARPYSCGFDFATKISKANPQKKLAITVDTRHCGALEFKYLLIVMFSERR